MSRLPIVALAGLVGLALGMTTLARAAPDLSGILEHQGPNRPARWYGAYLLAEGDPEARIVTTLPRGTRMTLHPDRSNDRYYAVTAQVRGGKAIEGYVWKEFVRVLAAREVAVNDSVAKAPAPSSHADEARVGDVAVKPAAAPSPGPAAPQAAAVASAPRKHAAAKIRPRPRTRARMPVDEEAAPETASIDGPVESAGDDGVEEALYGDPSPERQREAVRKLSAQTAAHLTKVRRLKRQIEGELDAMPTGGKLSPGAARRADKLLAALDELNTNDRKISRSMETLSAAVQTHERAIKNLEERQSGAPGISGMGTADATKLVEQVDILRKAVLRAIMDASVSKEYARKVDAMEQAIVASDTQGLKAYYQQAARASTWRAGTPVGAAIVGVRGDVGAQIVGAQAVVSDRRISSIEQRLRVLEQEIHKARTQDGEESDDDDTAVTATPPMIAPVVHARPAPVPAGRAAIRTVAHPAAPAAQEEDADTDEDDATAVKIVPARVTTARAAPRPVRAAPAPAPTPAHATGKDDDDEVPAIGDSDGSHPTRNASAVDDSFSPLEVEQLMNARL